MSISQREARNRLSWPYMICHYLNELPEKSANIQEVAKHIGQTYNHHRKKKIQDIRSAILRACCQEQRRQKKDHRFTRCLNTDHLILTDFQWIEKQNDLRQPKIVDCKMMDPSEHLEQSLEETLPHVGSSFVNTRSQANSLSMPEPFGTIQVKIEGVPKSKPKRIVDIVSLISDDEEDDNSITKSIANSQEWRKTCPLCNETFLTYEGVGVHVQMHGRPLKAEL